MTMLRRSDGGVDDGDDRREQDAMRAVVVPDVDGGIERRQVPVPEPGRGEVRVAIDACGVCRGDDVAVDVGHLANARASVSGRASGTPIDAEDTFEFSARRDVTPVVDRYPLADAQAAYDAMTATDVRYRAVPEP